MEVRDTTSSMDKTVDLRHYGRIVWRHRAVIALCVVVSFCATLIALAFKPNEFESSVVLMVEDTGLVSRDVLDITGGMMQPQTGYKVDEERMAKLAGRIRSRPFLERVVRMLHMQEDPVVRGLAEERRRKYPDVSVEEMTVRILVENIQSRLGFRTRGPGVYEVTVADYSPQNARLLAWWISELFVDASDQRNLESIQEAEAFGQDRLRRFDESLRLSEQAYERATRGNLARDLDPNAVGSENLLAVEGLRQRALDEAAAARVRSRSYENALSAKGLVPDESLLREDPETRALASRLAATLQSEMKDRLTASPTSEPREWPPTGMFGSYRRDLLLRAERLAAEQYPDAGSESWEAIAGVLLSKIDAEAYESAAAMLERAVAEYRQVANSDVEKRLELVGLENDITRKRLLREKAEDYIVATDVRRAIEMANLDVRTEILDPARLPLAPSRPDRMKMMLASILLGSLLGAGFALVIETMDPVLRAVEDFSRIVPEPVLGTVPLLARKLEVRTSWLQRYWAIVAIAAVVLLSAAFFLVQGRMFYKLTATRTPVQMVSPEGGPDANH